MSLGQIMQSVSTMLSGNSAATSTNPVAPPHGQVAATPVSAPAPVAIVETPLDPYSKLWEAPPIDPNAPIKSASEMFKGLDPKAMLDAARKVNFTASATPEVLAKITAGGAEAGPALLALLNDVGQRAYAQASIASVGINQQALERFEQIQQANLPNQIRGHQVSDAVSQANSAFAHPAFAPVVGLIKDQMMTKYPNASPNEIAAMAVKYLDDANKMANPVAKPADGPKETNWLKLVS